MSIEGQGHFLYFTGFVCTRPRYQVSVYRTIGPLVFVLLQRLAIVRMVASVRRDGMVRRTVSVGGAIQGLTAQNVRIIIAGLIAY